MIPQLDKIHPECDMVSFTFREALDSDSDAVLSLYHTLIGVDGCTWSNDYPTAEDVSCDVANRSLYVLTATGGAIIAAAFAGACDELEGLECFSGMDKPCDVARVGVLRDLQNKGLGEYMIKSSLFRAGERGFRSARLLVSKANPHAMRLYGKCGFTLCGEAHMYGIDFYAMKRGLNKNSTGL